VQEVQTFPAARQKEKGATTAGDVGPELKSGVGTRLAAINTEQVRRQSEEESGASWPARRSCKLNIS
jgi:hypothetical protein